MTPTGWQRVGTASPTELVAARLELHYAAQIPAALGIGRAKPEADFGHHGLTWDAAQQALVSALVPGRVPYRAGLALAERTLFLLHGRGKRIEDFPLAGRTLREGLGWLTQASARLTGEPGSTLALPEQELPEHPLAQGAPFITEGASDAGHARELARWFANVEGVLGVLRASEDASPARVWSHHFDLDTVLRLGNERTLGVGFSPGDDSYAEPYLYVLPTPYPEERDLPALAPPLEWVTDGWIGAVLRGSHVAQLTPADQAELVERFYRSAIAALRPLLSRQGLSR